MHPRKDPVKIGLWRILPFFYRHPAGAGARAVPDAEGWDDRREKLLRAGAFGRVTEKPLHDHLNHHDVGGNECPDKQEIRETRV
jgi:hypothetical protein